MGLTVKDLYSTVLAVIPAGMLYAKSRGIELPLIGDSTRWAVLILAVVGIIMCTTTPLGERMAEPGIWSNPWITVAGILGAVCLVLILVGLITGHKLTLTLLASAILILWVITTLRHAVSA